MAARMVLGGKHTERLDRIQDAIRQLAFGHQLQLDHTPVTVNQHGCVEIRAEPTLVSGDIVPDDEVNSLPFEFLLGMPKRRLCFGRKTYDDLAAALLGEGLQNVGCRFQFEVHPCPAFFFNFLLR